MNISKRDYNHDIQFFFILGWNMGYGLAQKLVDNSRTIKDARLVLYENKGELEIDSRIQKQRYWLRGYNENSRRGR